MKYDKGSCYFICEALVDLEKNPDANTDYQHCVVSLAEGLTLLGYDCKGNVDYWQEDVDSEYLITHHPSMRGHHAIIISSHWLIKHGGQNCHDVNTLIQKITSEDIGATPVFLMADMQAEVYTLLNLSYLHEFHKVLLCGYVSSYNYPPNIVPWAFGLSNRIIKETEKYYNPTREHSLLWNFRMGHTSRELTKKYIIPALETIFKIDSSIDSDIGTSDYDLFMDRQTGRRHYPTYFKRLGLSKAIMGIGGYFSAAISKKRFSLINKLAFKLLRICKLPSRTIIQHDSWRFWEGLASSCVVFHADFYEFHIVYPVDFKNNIHYIGISRKFFTFNAKKALQKHLATIDLDKVAKEGKIFALTHYSPQAVAKRFLEYL